MRGYVLLRPAAPITLSKFWEIQNREQRNGASAVRFSLCKAKLARFTNSYQTLLGLGRRITYIC
jgi:hypothetical protein